MSMLERIVEWFKPERVYQSASAQKVRPIGYDWMGAEKQAYYDRLSEYKAPFLEERLADKKVFRTGEAYQEAFAEFKKYVAVAKIAGGQIPMLSAKVDAVWHEFMLHSRKYAEFSDAFYGGFFHHEPYEKGRKKDEFGALKFAEQYTKLFGQVPMIWGREAYKLSALVMEEGGWRVTRISEKSELSHTARPSSRVVGGGSSKNLRSGRREGSTGSAYPYAGFDAHAPTNSLGHTNPVWIGSEKGSHSSFEGKGGEFGGGGAHGSFDSGSASSGSSSSSSCGGGGSSCGGGGN